ncbi:MAG TPA: hypothetical protein ENN12_02485 [Epsilonproteobacteria bacterium]|nr:hypothetical protein [Campylobacterota bacterium]
MSNNLEKLKALTGKLEKKLSQQESLFDFEEKLQTSVEPTKPKEIDLGSIVAEKNDNLNRFKILFDTLEIGQKCPVFERVFDYKAMNLSGIGLKEDDFGEVRPGKYIQIIAISYESDGKEKKKAKNISLGYFGKSDSLEKEKKSDIIEFVLRWRYEKAFQNLEHYKELIDKLNTL